MRAWAIKIGGSLYTSKLLVGWLENIARFADQNIVIIPGGGPFSDQVRKADKKFNLNQRYSHLMAVLGMQQYGTLLASLGPAGMQLSDSEAKIRLHWEHNQVAIWEPFDMVREKCPLQASWEITSDSIAAWLASFMRIDNLLLIKSTEQVQDYEGLDGLADQGCIDKALPKLIAGYNLNLRIAHKSQTDELGKILMSAI